MTFTEFTFKERDLKPVLCHCSFQAKREPHPADRKQKSNNRNG